MKIKSILFVCMGNICRSPTAEGVFRSLADEFLIKYDLKIDSAGTLSYHAGESPDHRASKAAKNRGYDLSKITARAVSDCDVETFDLVLVMDKDNFDNCQRQAIASGHEKQLNRIKLFLDYSKQSSYTDVPDPYYGGAKGFDLVIDLIEDASRGLIEAINNQT